MFLYWFFNEKRGGSNGVLVRGPKRGGKGYILIRSRDRGDFEAQEPRPRQGSKSKEKHRESKEMHRKSKEMHRKSKECIGKR